MKPLFVDNACFQSLKPLLIKLLCRRFSGAVIFLANKRQGKQYALSLVLLYSSHFLFEVQYFLKRRPIVHAHSFRPILQCGQDLIVFHGLKTQF